MSSRPLNALKYDKDAHGVKCRPFCFFSCCLAALSRFRALNIVIKRSAAVMLFHPTVEDSVCSFENKFPMVSLAEQVQGEWKCKLSWPKDPIIVAARNVVNHFDLPSCCLDCWGRGGSSQQYCADVPLPHQPQIKFVLSTLAHYVILQRQLPVISRW